MRPPWERVGGFAGILCFAKERTLLHAPGVIQPRSGSWRHCKHQPVSRGVVPAKAGIHGKPIWNLRFLLAWIPACAGMTVTHRVNGPFTWQVKRQKPARCCFASSSSIPGQVNCRILLYRASLPENRFALFRAHSSHEPFPF